MFLHRRHNGYVAWIACAAIVASTLLPSLARATHAARGVPAVVAELCSVHGAGPIVLWAPPAPADDPAQRGVTSRAAHCPGCLSSHDPGLLPSVRTAAEAPPEPPLQPTPRAAQGPASPAPWSPANPRAPPAAA